MKLRSKASPDVTGFMLDHASGLYLPRAKAVRSKHAVVSKDKDNDSWSTLWIAILSLCVAGLSAIFSYWSEKQNERRFTMDERSWVEIASLKFADEGNLNRVEISLRNLGKTPAYNLAVRASTPTLDADPADKDIDEVIGLYSATPEFVGSKNRVDKSIQSTASTLAPGATSTLPIVLTIDKIGSLSYRVHQIIKDYNQHTGTASEPPGDTPYLVGRVEYGDAFSQHHILRFCFHVVSDDISTNLTSCKTGNDEGDSEGGMLVRKWSYDWPFKKHAH